MKEWKRKSKEDPQPKLSDFISSVFGESLLMGNLILMEINIYSFNLTMTWKFNQFSLHGWELWLVYYIYLYIYIYGCVCARVLYLNPRMIMLSICTCKNELHRIENIKV